MDKNHSIYADLKKPKRIVFPVFKKTSPPVGSISYEEATRCFSGVLEHIADLEQDEQDQ